MATKLTIDPVTRLEGHLKISIDVDIVEGVQQVVQAWASGTMFRGFEKLLLDRDPNDAPHLTQRVCGVCPIPHAMASVMAIEAAYRIKISSRARIIRNLILGANYLQSHLLSFYHLSLMDYIDGPDMPPWRPAWSSDKRVGAEKTSSLVNNYVSAIDISRKAHEMAAIFSGRIPHTPVFVPGGVTSVPTADRISRFMAYLTEITDFISNVYIPDVEYIASQYDDYYSIGRGYGNLLAFGVFDLDSKGKKKLLKRGRVTDGSTDIQTVDVSSITEDVTYSWYDNNNTGLNPSAGETIPQYPKDNAYSWLKAPRYLDMAYETGPLARMWVNGDYQRGISVLDRHRARAYEALKIANAMNQWVSKLKGSKVYSSKSTPSTASSYGLTEAPRGALGHWIQINNNKLSHYQLLTPTCWNASPADDAGLLGPLEKAIIGTPVQNSNEPVEVMRVIHSFDPCLSCAVH